MNNVERAYQMLREKAVRFELKPGERLNEVELARELGMSRAPVREAMNRLVTEELLTVVPNQGFSCRKLSASEIAALYGVRADLELGGIHEAAHRVDRTAVQELGRFWEEVTAQAEGLSIETLVAHDEDFHRKLAMLAGNVERVRLLEHINARIYFVRQINLEIETRRRITFDEHREIVARLLEDDPESAANLLRRHLSLSAEEAMDAIRRGLARIYAESVT
jgi:DNA-binding GntR family transcriptional regulator